MNTLETIFTRKSVRQFKNQKVDEKNIKQFLQEKVFDNLKIKK